jgi:sulfur-carrier protein
MMRIRLLAFASASDAIGARERSFELPAGSTVRDLRSRLAAEYPGLESLWPRLAIAVDGEVARPDTPLRDGCETALLPPVSGG